MGEPTGLPTLLSVNSLAFLQEHFCDLPTRGSAEVGVEKAELTSVLDVWRVGSDASPPSLLATG